MTMGLQIMECTLDYQKYNDTTVDAQSGILISYDNGQTSSQDSSKRSLWNSQLNSRRTNGSSENLSLSEAVRHC
jgi:hypothetical protein